MVSITPFLVPLPYLASASIFTDAVEKITVIIITACYLPRLANFIPGLPPQAEKSKKKRKKSKSGPSPPTFRPLRMDDIGLQPLSLEKCEHEPSASKKQRSEPEPEPGIESNRSIHFYTYCNVCMSLQGFGTPIPTDT